MLERHDSLERGDTLIEVLIALAILAAVIATTLSIMNFGLSNAQASNEKTEVQALINGQANILRAARDDKAKAIGTNDDTNWDKITDLSKTTSAEKNGCKVKEGLTPFYFATTGNDWTKPVSNSVVTSIADKARQPKPGNGIWIEAIRNAGGAGATFYDFYIKACWSSVGSGPHQEIKSVVRLYEP